MSAFNAVPFTELCDNPATNSNNDAAGSEIGQTAEAKNEALIQQKMNLSVVVLRNPISDDVPPAIEPRKEQQVAPTPPPRPKKPIEMSPSSLSIAAPGPVPPPKHLDSPSSLKSPAAFFSPPAVSSPKPPAPAPPAEEPTIETLELVTPHKQKSLTLKKKNSILAKRRRIAVKSLPHSDIQGHLYRRTKDKTGTSYWAKGYFVLADNALYCFRTKDAVKADFLVFLSGFTVSLASEIHSKPFAFKVYHALKTLYFAAESQEALNQWMDYLRRATMKISAGAGAIAPQITDVKEIFTETESSEEDDEEGDSGTPSNAVSEVQKHEKYHLGLGSLKKFTKSNNPFSSNKNSGEKKHNDLPIPSSQFRSYKKVQGYAGLSPGNHFFPPDSSLNPISVTSPTATHFSDTSIISSGDKEKSVPSPATPGGSFFSSKIPMVKPEENVKERGEDLEESGVEKRSAESSLRDSPSKKFQPHNYIHASNPNLVDFEHHHQISGSGGGFGGLGGGKAGQFSYKDPSMLNGGGSVTGTNGGHSLQGCMTLMDLMLQQQAEDAKEVYNNRVFLGQEKEGDIRRRRQRKDSHKSENHLKITYGTGTGGDQKFDKIQSRTLPKTPDYAQSFKPDDVDIIMIRSKEGQSLRNFGYEFISEEDPQERETGSSAISAATLREKSRLMASRKTDKVSPTTSWSRRKGRNWINTTDKQHGNGESSYGEKGRVGGGSGSFKNKGHKFDTLKNADRFFSFNKIVGGGYDAKKSSSPGQSPSHCSGGATLASLNGKKGSFFSLTDGGVLGGTKKVPTPSSSNSGLDEAGGQGRKLSSTSTASYFSKLSFSGSGRSASGVTAPTVTGSTVAKEKKIFGSPRLHRAIFGKNNASNSNNSPGNRSPIFDEVFLGQGSWMDTRREWKGQSGAAATTTATTGVESGGPSQSKTLTTASNKNGKAPDYVGLECPPVFRPETYSLAMSSDPNSLMRRRNNVNKKSA